MNIVGKKIGLSTQVFSAMILGAVFGLLFAISTNSSAVL